MSNLRQRILAKNDRRSNVMEIPEWGVSIEVRGMSARMRNRFIEALMASGLDEKQNIDKIGVTMIPILPEFVLEGVYDPETGEKVFQPGDLDALLDKDGAIIERIAQKVIELSALGEKAVDEAGKSSSVIPNDASITA